MQGVNIPPVIKNKLLTFKYFKIMNVENYEIFVQQLFSKSEQFIEITKILEKYSLSTYCGE